MVPWAKAKKGPTTTMASGSATNGGGSGSKHDPKKKGALKRTQSLPSEDSIDDPHAILNSLDSTLNDPLMTEEERIAEREARARRNSVADLLFWCSIGNLPRVQRIVDRMSIDVASSTCRDYDMRTPLHLAASGGSIHVTDWLLRQGAEVNGLDRFHHTPLEDALRAEHTGVVRMLINAGGLVAENSLPGAPLVPMEESELMWLPDRSANFVAAAEQSAAARGKVGFTVDRSAKTSYNNTSVCKETNQLVPNGRLMYIESKWEIRSDEVVIGKQIGAGEFGSVHAARWRKTPVAVKTLNLDAADNMAVGELRNEIISLVKCHHPNTVQFLGACTRSAPYMIVSELCVCSLAEVFHNAATGKGPVLTTIRACEFMIDCSRALAYLHRVKPVSIIHRDLKPANLMIAGCMYRASESKKERDDIITKYGVLKVGDFGLCRTLPAVRTRHERTLPNPAKPTVQCVGSVRGRLDARKALLESAKSARLTTSEGIMICDPSMEDGHKHDGEDQIGTMPTTTTTMQRQNSSGLYVTPRGGGGGGQEHHKTADPYCQNNDEDLYRGYDFTGETGSYRYMAPEVYRHEPYSYKVDAYAFAMIAYQAFELIPPFMNLSALEAAEAASIKGHRPKFQQLQSRVPSHEPIYSVPLPLRTVITKCWAPDPKDRPNFNPEVIDRLEAVHTLLTEEPYKRGVSPRYIMRSGQEMMHKCIIS
ncbi:hypothetical protein PPROV_000159000 [Pycnococcus provasolii]|uniref:Protein kinase domain-containing protein n=1 Tax=Pycnococcus provasolii TaxID=41880 RepID=A0A830H722_9CHLO|nr:hypothetical protein PPROV_000159000 [Pycnococcus provasolii]|mmetsp:Transcript_9195/g.24750  ORF Transcript_9195/g.24750 Transcript_9195/m.24750 type:complete len:706 (+) Transcript_9195:77-2194(+)